MPSYLDYRRKGTAKSMATPVFTFMKTVSRSEIEARLSSVGLEMTPQRFAMLEYLLRHDGPSTTEQILKVLCGQHPRPSYETIRRTLKTLCDAHLVNEVYADGAKILYSLNPELGDQFVVDEMED